MKNSKFLIMIFVLGFSFSIKSQNIGIGTVSPQQKLHIKGRIKVDTLLSGSLTDSIVTVDLNSVFQKISSSKYLSNIYNTDGTLTGNRIVTLDTNNLTILSNKVNAITIDTNTLCINTRNNRVGIGTITPNARLDIRTNPTSKTDPGEGMFGLGTSNINPSIAGAGALRYNPASGGTIQYSNGSTWTPVVAAVVKSVVTAYLDINAYTFRPNMDINVTNWTKVKEVGHDTLLNPGGFFNGLTGVYTAPRNGSYLVSCSLLPVAYISNGGNMEVKIVVNNVARIVTVIGTPPTPSANYFGAPVSGTVVLNAGDQISIRYWSGFGGANKLSHGNIFNTLSIIEL